MADKKSISLRSQIATSKEGRGGRRYLPYAFTEHGAIMAANIRESRTLASLRDTLLPKFLSGEIRFKDAEKFTEVA